MILFLLSDAGRRFIGFALTLFVAVVFATPELRDVVLPLAGDALMAAAAAFQDLVIAGAGEAQAALDNAAA